VFEALGAVDGSQGTEDTQHPEDLDHRDSTGAEYEGDEGDGND